MWEKWENFIVLFSSGRTELPATVMAPPALTPIGQSTSVRRQYIVATEGAMLGYARIIKFAIAIGVALAASSVATESRAQTGYVHISVVKVGFIIGVGGGHGTLFYHGHRYRLSVGGIGIGSLGIAGAELSGVAHNLHRPADIAGTYGIAGAGGTFVGGGSVARLQNERGVVLELRGPQLGFQVSLGLGGMTIALR
jgi:hypothetical protein